MRLIYVCVDTSDVNVRRVRERVAQGGHHVPEDDIRRRYERSLANARTLIRLVGEATIYDNTTFAPKRVLEFRNGQVTFDDSAQAPWAKALLGDE